MYINVTFGDKNVIGDVEMNCDTRIIILAEMREHVPAVTTRNPNHVLCLYFIY